MDDRFRFWLRALVSGATAFNTLAGWFSLIILLLGTAAGISVPLVFHVPHWLTPVIIAGAVLLAMQEGSYQVWSGAVQRTKQADQRAEEASRRAEQADHRAEEADRNRAIADAALKAEQAKPRGGDAWHVAGSNNTFVDSQGFVLSPGTLPPREKT